MPLQNHTQLVIGETPYVYLSHFYKIPKDHFLSKVANKHYDLQTATNNFFYPNYFVVNFYFSLVSKKLPT